MTPLTTKAAEIRAGLVGVTPGPWAFGKMANGYGYAINAATRFLCSIAARGAGIRGTSARAKADAAHIARLDPATVLAFLDERDQHLAHIEQQAAELAEARKEHRNIQTALMEETARTIAAERRATTAESERDEARAALQVAKDGWRDAEASAAALKAERDELLREKERLGAGIRECPREPAPGKATEAEGAKTIECPVRAKIVPFSSVVGQSVMLTDETGAAVAHLSISVPSPSYPYRETAEEIACIIETAINQPPTEEVKKLRVRLAKLMVEDAKRMAALENAPAGLADATNNPPSDPGTEQREAGV